MSVLDTTMDPITLALVQNRLDYIARQMGWVMTRTARSPIFNQSHDFSCFIADPEGTLVSQADGIPIHTGGGGFAVRAVLRDFAGRIDEGDVFVLNDPYVAGGNHLPDWVIARPVFVQGRLAAFACNRAHQSDIGGGAAGTYNAAATEIFHEGLRLPVLKLIEKDVTRDDLWRLLQLNSRTPDLLDGDLRAMIGSTRIGGERIAALVEELGIERGFAAFKGILDHADRSMRARIAKLPDGVYEGLEIVDNDCFEPANIPVKVTITVAGDAMTVDFTGSAPQMRGFKNSSIANTWSAVYMAIASFFEPDLPRNEGTFRTVEIIAPEGSVVNPRPPAPMTMNTVFIAHEIIHAIWQALAQADPSRACAGWGKAVHGVTAGGIGSPKPFVMYHWGAASAGGACEGRDGFNQIGHLIALGGLVLPNAEVFEQLYPCRVLRQEFRCDTAGAGEYRGGTGIEYGIDLFQPAEYSFRGEGLGAPSGYGTLGGQEGAGGHMTYTPLDGGPSTEAPKFGVRRLPPLHLAALSAGGGGWGHPRRRDPAAVLRDVRDGVVSVEAARDTYGVVIGGDGRSIDEPATLALRG